MSRHWGLYDPYQQQDAQEFLNFLLDAIHEGLGFQFCTNLMNPDLNSAERTPFSVNDEQDGILDTELASQYWKSHTLRNNSIIVDTFYGQYRSKIACNTCNKGSTKFDPFMSLTLEMPPSPVDLPVIIVDKNLSRHQVIAHFYKS